MIQTFNFPICYQDFVTTERLNGVDMGVNYANRHGATVIVDHLGEEMLRKLVNFIKTNTNALGISVKVIFSYLKSTYMRYYLLGSCYIAFNMGQILKSKPHFNTASNNRGWINRDHTYVMFAKLKFLQLVNHLYFVAKLLSLHLSLIPWCNPTWYGHHISVVPVDKSQNKYFSIILQGSNLISLYWSILQKVYSNLCTLCLFWILSLAEMSFMGNFMMLKFIVIW